MSSSLVESAVVQLRLVAVTHRFLSTRDIEAELQQRIGRLPADLQQRLQPEKLRSMVQSKRRFLMLQEIGGSRVLALSANEADAAAASMWLGGQSPEVPSTHDLLMQFAQLSGRRPERVRLEEVTADGMTARILFATEPKEPSASWPCRPVDGVNFAARLGIPIEATAPVMLFAGYTAAPEGDELVRIVPGAGPAELPDRLSTPRPAKSKLARVPRSVDELLARIARGEVVVVDQPEGFLVVPVPAGCVAEPEAIRLAGGRGRLDEAIRRGTGAAALHILW